MGPKREIRNHIICENKKFRHKCFIHISIICFKSKNIKMGSFLLCLGLKPISPRMVLAVGTLVQSGKGVDIHGHFLTSLVQKGTCHTTNI